MSKVPTLLQISGIKSGFPESLSVLVVDDHPIVRAGVRLAMAGFPGAKIRAEAGTAEEALRLAAELRPDALILDLMLGGRDGLDLLGRMRVLLPAARILVFSMNAEDLFAERALNAGANGYLMKGGDLEELQVALKSILEGETYLSERMKRHMTVVPGAREKGPLSRLSDRELQIFLLLGQGKSTQQIADELGVSMKTVSAHRENLKIKLGVESAPELVRQAVAYVVGQGRGT